MQSFFLSLYLSVSFFLSVFSEANKDRNNNNNNNININNNNALIN